MDTIAIPFLAKDFETLGWTFIIPEGFTAKIEDGKIIVKKEETEDERIIKQLVSLVRSAGEVLLVPTNKEELIAWLEKQKPEHFELKAGKWYICHRAFCCRADHLTVKEGERFMCEKDGVVKGFVIKEPEKYFIECSAPAPMEDRCKDCPHRGDMFLLTQGFKSGKHELAIKFMSYLDENRPEGKMGLSNSECEDIDKAFKENDWEKIMQYAEKYLPHWKPSEEQMKQLKSAADLPEFGPMVTTQKQFPDLGSLYEQLKK